jgi:trimethylamine--corrinoid protein Co-methyltransferase
MVDSGMALDYSKLMLDDEINKSIKHLVKGMQVNEETLSVELIKEVGHSGEYLTHSSTLDHFGDALLPSLMNRESYEGWLANGATNLYERALQKARKLVEGHQPEPLSDQAQKEIAEIIRETEKELQVCP